MGGVCSCVGRTGYARLRLPASCDVDLDGKVAIVTGGYTGCGLETVKALMLRRCHVVLAGRTQSKADAAMALLTAECQGSGSVQFLRVDLLDLDSVVAFVAAFRQLELPLHFLIHNAGMHSSKYPGPSVQGWEQMMTANHFAPMLMTLLLDHVLRASAPSRVVVVSSRAYRRRYTGTVDWDNVRRPSASKHSGLMPSMRLYGASKACVIMMTRALAKIHQDTGVTYFSVHPGGVDTAMTRAAIGTCPSVCLLVSPEEGAVPALYASLAPGLSSGDYFEATTRPTPIREDLVGPEQIKSMLAGTKEFLDPYLDGAGSELEPLRQQLF